MEIYLDHPANGAMVVYSLAEAALMEAKGWKIRKPKEAAPEPAVETAEAPKPRGRPRKA